MKALFTGVMLMLSVPSFAGEIVVKVNGMVCSMCAQGIQKKFKAQADIKQVDVNLENKYVNLTTQEGATISDETITNLIKEAGYHVERIERK